MAPYEALYGRKRRPLLCSNELGERKVIGLDLVAETEDKKKSYADLKRKDIEFKVGDCVFLKVSSRKKVLKFGHKVLVEEIELMLDFSFKEEPVQILDREVKVLRRKTILLVKVLWWNHGSEEAIGSLRTQFDKNTYIFLK
ncbi:uncharacterized protein LOC108484773 [Gossypium arboreum]|uniref:uncharacterized protein LOC108484773 n=1 Tax=Gossypium arboreum TaxID=29729 RepID=UPI0008196881|nr:uncharacterized protein LOC108484773 [Gossypium arboreum]